MKTVKGTHAPRMQAEPAFSRADLIITIVVVVFVLLVISPGLADTRYRSQRAGCIDNLRQIGQAVQLWAADHGNNNSWLVPTTEGGTRPNSGAGKVGNAWLEFYWLRSQLATPKILVCPADSIRFANSANNWSQEPNSGYAGLGRQNRATSYVIGLHALFSDPNSLLSSDRNLRVASVGSSSCFAGINNASTIILQGPSANTAWTNSIHQSVGNLLLNDGRVLETSNSGLTAYLQSLTAQQDTPGSLHMMFP